MRRAWRGTGRHSSKAAPGGQARFRLEDAAGSARLDGMSTTTIQAFRMHLKPGNEAEYARRHAQLWPEMKELLRQAGVSDYNIFLDRATGNLFAVQRVSGEGGSQDLGDNPICRKWWDFMADLMDVNPDNSPVSVPLEQVFHLD